MQLWPMLLMLTLNTWSDNLAPTFSIDRLWKVVAIISNDGLENGVGKPLKIPGTICSQNTHHTLPGRNAARLFLQV